VVRHNSEGMQCEFPLIAVAEEGGDHEVGGLSALEQTVALVGEDGDGVGTQFLTLCGHEREHTPGAKALPVPGSATVTSLKAWLT
ncbi:MAG: hypothetical protein P4L87_18890, partial [Formivibrio sp.]|nr:hypothetical protein [Formivibrio sp.]